MIFRFDPGRGIHGSYRPATDDAIAVATGTDRVGPRETGAASVFFAAVAQRFHASPAFGLGGRPYLSAARLSQFRPVVAGVPRASTCFGASQGAAFHNAAKSRATPKKRAFDQLLQATFGRAKKLGLMDENPHVSVDATGLESHYVSRHFLARRRRGRPRRTRQHQPWTKLTCVVHHASHLIAGLVIERGPCNDAPSFTPVVTQASRYLTIGCVSADAAYDAEAHHRLCREKLAIPQTIIPINSRGHPETIARTPYRRRLQQRFPKKRYQQRWLIESAFSRFKRRLHSALRATSESGRLQECWLRAITFNCLLLALWNKGFYQAY